LPPYRDWQFITFDCSAPDFPNLLKISDPKYRPVDFMPYVDGGFKPGYSTFGNLTSGSAARFPNSADFEESALLEGIADHTSPSNS